MDTGEAIVYFVVILAFIGFMGIVGYLTYDYLEYKKTLASKLLGSSRDINYNFDISSSNFDLLDKRITEQGKDVTKNTTGVSDNLSKINSTSNVISNRITETSNIFVGQFTNTSNILNNFDSGLKKYFDFKEGETSLGTNNKIFNYIFGATAANQPKMDLIKQTTAIGGMTIVSEAPGTEFKVCNSAATDAKCINMNTDANGNFSITPKSVDSITIKNNDATAQTPATILGKFDTKNKAVYLGGGDAASASLYTQGNDVYVKNLKLLSANGQPIQNNALYTTCSITNTIPTTAGTTTIGTTTGTTTGTVEPFTMYEGFEVMQAPVNVNSTITIRISFKSTYNLSTNRKLFMHIPYINIDALNSLQLNLSTTESLSPQIFVSLTKSDSPNKSSEITYDNNLTIRFQDTLQTIEEGYELTFKITTKDQPNITTLSSSANISFATSSYFIS